MTVYVPQNIMLKHMREKLKKSPSMVKGINKLLSKTKSKKSKHVVIFKKFDLINISNFVQ